MRHTPPRRLATFAVTLLELLVVVLIISILATIATGVYTGETRRARIAATQDLIRQLEVAITRYEVDLGQFPPPGTGDIAGPISSIRDGSGLLHLALVHSLTGSAFDAPDLWRGPYITFRQEQLDPNATEPGTVDILDAWGNPLVYVESGRYGTVGNAFTGGTHMFPTADRPPGSNLNLPAPNPFVEEGETYYNTSTYQIYSIGPNESTYEFTGTKFAGTEEDDLNNFGY